MVEEWWKNGGSCDNGWNEADRIAGSGWDEWCWREVLFGTGHRRRRKKCIGVVFRWG